MVAEAPGQVAVVSAVKPTLLEFQLKRVWESFPVSCVKTGMLATSDHVHALARFLEGVGPVPLVVDPVLRATAGVDLLDPAGISALRERLLPRASLVTPNLPEAERFLGQALSSESDREAAVRLLHEQLGCDVLLKGGHAGGDTEEVIDHAWLDGQLHRFARPRLDVPDLHGTGCTLSAAIAARLARGEDLVPAVAGGIDYLRRCLERSYHWPDPAATGALNHFPDEVDSEGP